MGANICQPAVGLLMIMQPALAWQAAPPFDHPCTAAGRGDPQAPFLQHLDTDAGIEEATRRLDGLNQQAKTIQASSLKYVEDWKDIGKMFHHGSNVLYRGDAICCNPTLVKSCTGQHSSPAAKDCARRRILDEGIGHPSAADVASARSGALVKFCNETGGITEPVLTAFWEPCEEALGVRQSTSTCSVADMQAYVEANCKHPPPPPSTPPNPPPPPPGPPPVVKCVPGEVYSVAEGKCKPCGPGYVANTNNTSSEACEKDSAADWANFLSALELVVTICIPLVGCAWALRNQATRNSLYAIYKRIRDDVYKPVADAVHNSLRVPQWVRDLPQRIRGNRDPFQYQRQGGPADSGASGASTPHTPHNTPAQAPQNVV